jgi:hypothetical protein
MSATTPQSAGTPEMVEQVARALAADPFEIEQRFSDGVRWAIVIDWENSPELFRLLARRAIAAMRTPTEAMLDAGHGASASIRLAGVPLVWQAMLDAALAAPDPPPAPGNVSEATTGRETETAASEAPSANDDGGAV